MPVPRGSTKKRIPSAMKLLKGSFNSSRENPNEPQPDPHFPAPPEHLNERQLAAWEEIGALLRDYRVTSLSDLMALEALACVLADCRHLRATLRAQAEAGDDSMTYQVGDQRRIKPEVQLLKQRESELREWLGRFGLTPADRGRVSSSAAPRAPREFEDPDAEFADPEDEFA